MNYRHDVNDRIYICPKMDCKDRKECAHAKLHSREERIEEGDENCEFPLQECPACIVEFLNIEEMMI